MCLVLRVMPSPSFLGTCSGDTAVGGADIRKLKLARIQLQGTQKQCRPELKLRLIIVRIISEDR